MENVEFELTYAALKMFGKQLYSNVGSAIAELVANGIDAGAEEVYVAINVIDKHNATVEILDNGAGMTYADIKEHYIKIGYNKRKNTSIGHNKMLGRKGIGKLAALYLSDCFSIVTKNSQQNQMHWKLDVTGMQDETKPILKDVGLSVPENLICKAMWEKQMQGTYIFLENVDFERFGEKGFEALESRLSNFFLYDELGVKININIATKKEEIGKFKEIKKKTAFKNMVCIYTDDIDEFNKREKIIGNTYELPYENKLGDNKKFVGITEVKAFTEILDKDEIEGKYKNISYKLKGWIGVHSSIDKDVAENNDSRYLKNQFYNPNQLRVYVRNKLGMNNMLEHLGIARAFGNYIEGEVVFDILDDDELEDIATAGRQDFDSQDDRFILLKEMMTKLGNSLVSKRQKVADEIKKVRKEEDNYISANAKAIYKRELHKEIEALTDYNEESKAAFETVLVNKIEGNPKLEPKAQYTVFLSHASKDSMISDCIYYYLKSLGFNGDLSDKQCEIFYSSSGMDSENLEPLSQVIRDAIIAKNNDILFLASKNFMNSPFCLFEGGAAWATRAIDEYKIMAMNYNDIPTFLTNGKSEIVLGMVEEKDFELDAKKYNDFILVLNRLINHLNKNREIRGEQTVDLLSKVIFPDKVQLSREKKAETDYMDQTVLEYWNTYIRDNAKTYIKENSLK